MVVEFDRIDNCVLDMLSTNSYENTSTLNFNSQELDDAIRKITSRLAIYRKLKELGHSDDTIFSVYHLSMKEN